ncbi:hypothetical protein BgiBS90_005721 [Biomphalaria glabrata]|nr:hypothetical protein BgiBS90_005721 [Biomphalaria glabrata]
MDNKFGVQQFESTLIIFYLSDSVPATTARADSVCYRNKALSPASPNGDNSRWMRSHHRLLSLKNTHSQLFLTIVVPLSKHFEILGYS